MFDFPLEDKILFADSIEFSYDDHSPLLTGVYIECKIGDVVALLGRNGSGKSTLLQIIFGSISPKNGYISVNGKRIIKGYLTKKICYLPQDSFLPTHFQVQKIIKLLVSSVKSQKTVMEDKIVEKILTQKIADISGGERRYLELLLLFQIDVDFYILDEPFSGLSPFMKDQIQTLILSKQKDKGFIISDHQYNSVLDVATKILLLQNGGCRSINNKKDLELFYVPSGTFDSEL